MSRINNEVVAIKAAVKTQGCTPNLRQIALALLTELSYWTKNPLFYQEYEKGNISTSESRPFEEAVRAEKELAEIFSSLDQMGAV